MTADWIAVDWGTSHLRLWRMTNSGEVLGRAEEARGMARLTPEQARPVLLERLASDLAAERKGRPLQVICCGMGGEGGAGPRHAPVPCAPLDIAGITRLDWGDPRLEVILVPGLSQAAPADVMRGQETRIAGYLSQHPAFDGVLCLPGPHCKWVHVSAGEVVSFKTVMTGEMFALLAEQSVLRSAVAAEGMEEAVFVQAVSRALSRPEALVGDLFSLRAEALLTGLAAGVARSRLSGLLIGAELAAVRPWWLGREVVIIGDGALAGAYGVALAAQGVQAGRAGDEEMVLRGLVAARGLL